MLTYSLCTKCESKSCILQNSLLTLFLTAKATFLIGILSEIKLRFFDCCLNIHKQEMCYASNFSIKDFVLFRSLGQLGLKLDSLENTRKSRILCQKPQNET